MSIPDSWEVSWDDRRKCWVGIQRDEESFHIIAILFAATHSDLCKDIQCVSNGQL